MPVALALVTMLAVEPPPAASDPCVAAPMWQALAQEVPQSEDTRKLRARIGHGKGLATRADSTADELASARLCLESVEAYGEVMSDYYAETERGRLELRRAQDEAHGLRRTIEMLVAALPPPPEPPRPSAQELWTRKHRRLVGLTIAAGVSLATGVLMTTLAWTAPCDDPYHGCAFRILGLTTVGVPIAIASSVGVIGWSVMLVRHRADRPAEVALGPRLRVEPTGAGWRFGRIGSGGPRLGRRRGIRPLP